MNTVRRNEIRGSPRTACPHFATRALLAFCATSHPAAVANTAAAASMSASVTAALRLPKSSPAASRKREGEVPGPSLSSSSSEPMPEPGARRMTSGARQHASAQHTASAAVLPARLPRPSWQEQVALRHAEGGRGFAEAGCLWRNVAEEPRCRATD